MDLPIPGTFLAAGEMYYMSRRVAAETVMVSLPNLPFMHEVGIQPALLTLNQTCMDFGQ